MNAHVKGFIAALNGGRGTLDAWLECNNEAECRAAINGYVAAERTEMNPAILDQIIRQQEEIAELRQQLAAALAACPTSG